VVMTDVRICDSDDRQQQQQSTAYSGRTDMMTTALRRNKHQNGNSNGIKLGSWEITVTSRSTKSLLNAAYT